MTAVIIHPDTAGGQTLRDLIRELADLTPGRPRTTGSGVQVTWDVAQAYLNRKLPLQSTAPPAGADAAGQAAHGGDSPPGVSGGPPGGEPTPPAKPRKSTPPRKTTAAAQQRASRTPRSNP